jgi:hypothetical protein
MAYFLLLELMDKKEEGLLKDKKVKLFGCHAANVTNVTCPSPKSKSKTKTRPRRKRLFEFCVNMASLRTRNGRNGCFRPPDSWLFSALMCSEFASTSTLLPLPLSAKV